MTFWSRFEPSSCYPDKCQCEAVRDTLIRQPSSFWSSLAYIFAGLAIYRIVREKSRDLKMWTVVCCLMGLTSMFGHGSFIRVSLALDFASIVLVLSFFALMNFLKKFSTTKIMFMFTTYYIALFSAMYYMGKFTKIGACLLIFAVSLGDAAKQVHWSFEKDKYLHWSLAILALSFGFFIIDEMHIGCVPHSLFQFHSLWHLGTGLSMYFYGKWRFTTSV